MKYKTLGRTGLVVSEIGFGTWAIGGNDHGNSYGPTDDETSTKAIAKALELGCNFFDTADVYGYGHSETVLGQGLKAAGKLNDVIIATTVGGNFYSGKIVVDFSRAYIRKAIQESLKRLQRDYIDLYQLHNPSRPVIEDGQVFEVLDELKKEGLIRHYGVSNHSVQEGIACIKSGKPATLQLVYNLTSMIQSENPADQLFPLAKENNIGIIAREPLASGFLTGKQQRDTHYEKGDIRASWPGNYRTYKINLAQKLMFLQNKERTMTQAALRFVLDEPAISTMIVGVKTPQQAIENFAASELMALSEAEHKKVEALLLG
ncbi:MAG: aldo/keto reductase [Chloroflexi bacterium]|uniref:Aldo/keto reductase n=1 Tax=Candidatus Chlorohelix allophototropha TaxID=3003348 RepID=A0A8T7M6X8_9CHLR|nr:aldo/keto reductase [Chloroflexota bacterium]WJW69681.1 aldo/keto reductase [Chloroflexota bacterium L227-S17]